ncbi:MAG TPA: zinc metalloprotease HtpX [Phycisphaerales bacterium]|nr:zinc metalloprotease HtpX [Phycisphaerales bacterium]HMP37193.1 zinc metalloprotease HtpX [Phycisphaerales bacterium]
MPILVNNVKTVVLLAALVGLFVWVGAMLGSRTGMFMGLAIGLVMNFGAWYFSDTIAIRSMRGVEVDERTAPDLVRMVHRLANQAGLPMPRVYVCPQEAPNAFATGRSPRRSAVAVTQGALRLLDERELEGVMAHELAHIRNRDTLTSTIAATIAGVFSMMAQWALLFGGRGTREGGHPFAALAVILLGAVGSAIIKAMISRSREYVADADGARIAGSPEGLASALRKLESVARRVPMQTRNPAMNNLFIVEPFVGQTLTALFATHPPTEKRIAALLGRRSDR